jgi:glycosyltransferase involved in cell wall biosynthesis
MMNKTVLFDTTCLFDQYASRGIGRYTKEILRRIVRMILEDEWKVAFVGFEDIQKNLIEIGFSQYAIEELSSKIDFYSLGEPKDSSIKNFRNWKQFDKIIDEVEPTIYFAPHFERGLPSTKRLKHSYRKTKTVVVQHDVIPIVTNSYSHKGKIRNKVKQIFYKAMFTGVQNADIVITSSNFSKNDLVKYGKIDESKIKTIYLGVDESFFRKNQHVTDSDKEEILTRFEVKDQKYFIYDSGLETNKGSKNLINIFKEIKALNTEGIPSKLVVVGASFYKGSGQDIKHKNKLGENFLKEAKALGVQEDLITTGKITDEELKVLLAHSSAYLYMTEYEGFGFGPIQAMASEIPAIVNNSSCLPEITDGAAYLIDSKEYQKSAKEIVEFLSNEKLVEKYIELGMKLAPKYDWQDTAEKTWEEIRKVVDSL